MRCFCALAIIAALLISLLFCSQVAYGQVPKGLERCLPYPTFAEEIQAMRPSRTTTDEIPQPHVIIDSVNFDEPITLPKSAQERMLSELRQQTFPADSDWLDDVLEVPIRRTWQDEGYFKEEATAKARIVRADPSTRHVVLTVHVDEGPQFYLGDLEFRSHDLDEPLVFSRAELRKQVPLQKGQIFNADKIRKSLDNLRQLYATQGYIDFTAEPEFDINESTRRISLALVLDQQKQFRVGRIVVLGLDSKTEKALLSMIQPRDVFDPDALRQFLAENKSALPWDASLADIKVVRNVKTGIADLTFDFFTCRTD